MFNFAAERGILKVSPLAGMRKKPEKARDRVLNDAEIMLLWSALDLDNTKIDIFRVSKLALNQRPQVNMRSPSFFRIPSFIRTINAFAVNKVAEAPPPRIDFSLELILVNNQFVHPSE